MEQNTAENLWDHIHSLCDSEILYHSRIHRVRSFDTANSEVYLKREDESGFGISGYKRRKYASLLPFLLKKKYEKVFIIGGAYSNHVHGVSQLVKEAGLAVHAFLKAPHNPALKGNLFLNRLILSDEEITWVSTEEWSDILSSTVEIASRDAQHTYVIPEGGASSPSLPGTFTLLEDIQLNEQQVGFQFDHLFIDAGTGYTAAAIHYLNSLLERRTHLHVICMADRPNDFQQVYDQVVQDAAHSLSLSPPRHQGRLSLYSPYTATSFGSINRDVLEACLHFARQEGVFTDPVYATKLFMNAHRIIKIDQLTGSVLVIHSGGGTGLMGFSMQLEKIMIP